MRLWNVETATEVFALPALAVPAKALAFSPDGRTLAVGLDSADILLLDVATWRTIATLEPSGQYDSLTALAFLSDGNRLMFVGVGGQMVVWDSAAHRRVSDRYVSPKQSLYALALSRDGTRFAVGGDEHSASVWDMATGERVQILRGHVGDVYSLVFSPDGRTIYSGSGDANRREDHSIKVWRVSP